MANQTSESPPEKQEAVTAEKPLKHEPNNEKRRVDPTILVALIGAIGTIIVALLNSSLIEKWLLSDPTPTLTMTVSPNTPWLLEYSTATPIVIQATHTWETPAAPPTFTPTADSTPATAGHQMSVVLQSSLDEGKAPLKVNFDARESFVTFADGGPSVCGMNRFCSYDFEVYCNSKFIKRMSNNDGLLSYNFGAKGIYFVSVYVCRGEVCDDDGVTVDVK